MASRPTDPATDVAGPAPSAAAMFEQAMIELLRASHLMPPDALPDMVVELMRPVGVRRAVIYLADLQQSRMRPLPGRQSEDRRELLIDTTLAGRAYQHGRPQISETDDGWPRLWLPLIDGSERLGVLELVAEQADERIMRRYQALTSLVALLIVSKAAYSDTYARVRRIRPMKLRTEFEWAFMPPLSFATDEVIVDAAVEPAYEVGGDAFDYSLRGDRLQVSLFDACGHDLEAGIVASVALASCRNSRRAGASLTEMAAMADGAIHDQFGTSRFATALLCDLNVTTGRFSWLPCGHPPPLLIRKNRATELDRPPRPPLGVPADDSRTFLQHRQLQPRDRLLLYTDGVTEARDPAGDEFGVRRLVDFVNQHAGEGIPTAEALRRLTRAIVAHQHGRLVDDATIVQLQWRPDRPDKLVG